MRSENIPESDDSHIAPLDQEEGRCQARQYIVVGDRVSSSAAGSSAVPTAKRCKTRAYAKCCEDRELDAACPG